MKYISMNSGNTVVTSPVLPSFRDSMKQEHRSQPARPCQICGKTAVVDLAPHELAKQTDGTTHVCHPVLGGCNHGFAKDAAP